MNIYPRRFDKKVMIVTGAARGIGEAVALRAAAEGAKVVLVDKLAHEGEAVAKRIQDEGGDAIFLCLDLAQEQSAITMVEQTIKKYKRLDIAINNAGVMGQPGNVHELTKDAVDFTMQNNFYSVFYSCKHELVRFLEQGEGGVIVNNASIAGLTGLPGNPAYVASKHAVNGLTKNLALDYAKHGIRVNSVNPAGTDTTMTREAFAYVMEKRKLAQERGEKGDSMAGAKTQTMQSRQATADEQAASILFLASDDSTHMTGATVQTDGGWTSY